MEFLCPHDVPIPEIFDWSSLALNQVGAEYIIMERFKGELADTLPTMKERMAAVEKVVNIESNLFSLQFSANGSLFRDSLEAGVKSVDMGEKH